MNEVVAVRGGFRLRVRLPGETRRRRIPPTYKRRTEAERALALWQADVEGETLQCEHDLDRYACATCLGSRNKIAADTPSGRSMQIPFRRQEENPGPLLRDLPFAKKMENEQDLTERVAPAHGG